MADEKLRPEDATRIADAVESIERTVARLRSVQSLTIEERGAHENVETREAVERRFETFTAAVIDIAETVVLQNINRAVRLVERSLRQVGRDSESDQFDDDVI